MAKGNNYALYPDKLALLFAFNTLLICISSNYFRVDTIYSVKTPKF